MSKKPAHVVVRPRGRNDTQQRMIKRFLKKDKKFKILETYRETLRHQKPSERKRKQRKARERVLKKLAEENKIKDN